MTTTPADELRNRLAALLAHHADVLAARWDAFAPDPAAYSLRLHAGELTADDETPFVRELLDSILAFEAERPALAVARQVLGTVTAPPEGEAPAVDRGALERVRRECERIRNASVLADGLPHTDRERGAVQAIERVMAVLTDGSTPRESSSLADGLRAAADEIAGIDFHPNARARSLDIATGLVRRLRRLADEAQQPTGGEAEQEQCPPVCKCGHTQDRHALLSGTYAQCRHRYPEAGRGKCRCGMYRPQADEAQQPAPAVTEEQIVREHVTTVHLMGEQLATVESWLWERLADVRDAASADEAQQPAPAVTEEAETCRPVEVDGETIQVNGTRALTEQEQGYVADIVRAAKRRHEAERKPTPMTDYLNSRCDTCRHMLRRHDNKAGCIVPGCACGRFHEPEPTPGTSR